MHACMQTNINVRVCMDECNVTWVVGRPAGSPHALRGNRTRIHSTKRSNTKTITRAHTHTRTHTHTHLQGRPGGAGGACFRFRLCVRVLVFVFLCFRVFCLFHLCTLQYAFISRSVLVPIRLVQLCFSIETTMDAAEKRAADSKSITKKESFIVLIVLQCCCATLLLCFVCLQCC